nr:ammonium transporter [uncultured Desulfuromonas sp.]
MTLHNELDYHWVILCAFLVFMMQLGFAMVETGCVRSKNTINVAMKNLADATFGFIFFWLIGFGLMFGTDHAGLWGSSLFMIDGLDFSQSAFFFFQAMFATTSATIVSGAVAERMKFSGYVITAILVTSLIYPLFGHWAWGTGGWLKELGFVDFAGSTVVHSMGAWVGLAGALVLGPRLGKFHRDEIRYFAPSNHNFIVFGVFILWFSWFGFNAGSLLSFAPSVSSILMNTLISGATGGISAYLISLMFTRKVGVELFSFGIIAGLVGITAGCAEFTAQQSACVGFISAIIMFAAEKLLLHLRIDDPLSVVAIHGFTGVWGTLAVAFYGKLPDGVTRMGYFQVQAAGVLAAAALAFFSGLVVFMLLKRFAALRVSPRHEALGLNVTEHQAKLPWVETIESIIHIMRSGNIHKKIHEERGTEVGVVARFFNYLLNRLRDRQVELVASNKSLQSQVYFDPLTKVHNRRGALEQIRRRRDNKTPLSVIIIDIDHFKTINDTYGHDVGDCVLKELAELIQQLTRTQDLFARWGGEEFVLLCETLELDEARRIAEKLRASIAAYPFSTVQQITCSFGVCTPETFDRSFDSLFKEADEALYRAKELGRNRVCCS